MATKIRLQRHGKKGKAFYHVVIADSRAPRDGRFIEKVGVYNPNSNPATIDLDFDRALYWAVFSARSAEGSFVSTISCLALSSMIDIASLVSGSKSIALYSH